MTKEKHWTEAWIVEDTTPAGEVRYAYFNSSAKLIGFRHNKLMAQIALMDYCCQHESYKDNPNDYFLSLFNLLGDYQTQYEAMLKLIKGAINDKQKTD